MIEKITKTSEGEQRTDTLFRMPKNIRQIGQINDKKIYIEDYVMTYIRQLGSENNNFSAAVLLGRNVKAEEGKCRFLSGVIEIEEEILQENIFTDEVWNYIYEMKKQYFDELEIMGWALMQPGLLLEPTEQMEKIHIDNFAGQDKVMLLYDSIEREESFYSFEGKHLKKQSGYYIYYEKNEIMQNYMLDHKEDRPNPEIVEDRATKEIRKIFAGKKAKKRKKNTGFIFASGTAAAAIILLLGVSSGQNNQAFEKIFQNLLQGNQTAKMDAETQTTSVETITADEITIKGEQVVGDKTDQGDGTNQSSLTDTDTQKDITTKNKSTTNQISEETSSKKGTFQDNKSQNQQETDENKQEQDETAETMQGNTNKIEYYIVKKGDTLVSISKDVYQSRKYVDKIKEANGLEDADKIYIGQRLIMPQ